jgi:hypothetical protein
LLARPRIVLAIGVELLASDMIFGRLSRLKGKGRLAS